LLSPGNSGTFGGVLPLVALGRSNSSHGGIGMASGTPTCTWIGKSDKKYMHYVYPLPASIKAGEDGNYIYSKKNDEDKWVPIYIGEGELNERAKVDSHHQGTCIKSKKATHFHCHSNSAEKDRLAEEKDLLGNYTQAYKPNGCNEKLGG